MTLRILVVCSGNVCRSPLAERLLRANLAAALGTDAGRVRVASAGTGAVVGSGMDPRAAAVARTLGADPDGFVARSLERADVAEADLVLGATREHRAAAVRLHPPAHRYAFTVLEFARLAGVVEGLPAGDPVERGRALVAAAAGRRGLHRAARPAHDDVPDPHGGQDRVHREVGAVLDAALAVPVAVLAGQSPPPPPTPLTLDAPEPEKRPRRPAAGPRDAAGRTRPGGTRVGRRRRRRMRKVILRGTLAGLGLLVLAGGWLAVRGMQAQRELAAARADVATLKSAVLGGRTAEAQQALADAQRRTARARALTADPVWDLAAAPPVLGRTPAAVRAVAAAADDLATGTLPAVVSAGAELTPAKLRPSGDRVDVAAVARARPRLEGALAGTVRIRDQVEAIDLAGVPGTVADPVRDLADELAGTQQTLTGATRAARLLPTMLGSAGTRRYLVIFQNNAEARGTGGLPGVYAVLTVSGGRLSLGALGSNTDLVDAGQLPVDLGADFLGQWGQDPAIWQNSNLDPQFPKVARLWLALWERQTGQKMDGAIATDPVAVSYLLGAVGPVTIPGGEKVTADSIVQLTMSTVYRRFDTNAAQNTYLRTVGRRALQTVLTTRGRPDAMVSALNRAAGERRLMVWSAHASEQRELARTVVSGDLPDTPGPYAFVVVNNLAGSKMDYYLQRTVSYRAAGCPGKTRASTVTVTLENTATRVADLPPGVTLRLDKDKPGDRGAIVLLASVYGQRGAVLDAAGLDGKDVRPAEYTAGGRPVWSVPVVVGPGGKRTITLRLTEPATGAAPTVPVQPLVRPQATVISLDPCA